MSSPSAGTHDLAGGLVDYYASQADVLLRQYDNINQLLGPTTDWTHPGTLCEVLLRDWLRRFLPAWVGVDKGFIYGRRMTGRGERHSPEIDVLVHDTQHYQPLFRLDNFVIVRPEAVLAIIQVKRTLNSADVTDGLKNVTEAKQHVVDTLRQNDLGGIPGMLFSAVIGFSGPPAKGRTPYRKRLVRLHQEYKTFDVGGKEATSMWVLPNFVGSIRSYFVTTFRLGNRNNQRYLAYQSVSDGKNVALQTFLFTLTNHLGDKEVGQPPFAFPPGMAPFADFHILKEKKTDAPANRTPSVQ